MNFDLNKIKEYIEDNNIDNKDIKISINILKKKIDSDNQITNKKDVINAIENSYFLIDKGDSFSKEMFKLASKDSKIDPKCFVVFFENMYPIVFLSKNFEISDITHELNHVVEKYMKKNIVNIQRLFNFNYNFKEYSTIYNLLTNGNFFLKKSIDRNTINYLKEPSEIYARLNNLKHFLFENKFLKTPNQDIDKKITYELFTGEIFNNLLNDKIKMEFINSDFIQTLMFFDIKKYPEIYKIFKERINENKISENQNFIKTGPSYNIDMIYNPPMFSTNIGTNEFDTIKDFKTELIEDDYFKNINSKRKKRKKIKKFNNFKYEGAGFGNTDYRNVTGNATSSGYLNDIQPLGRNGTSNIASDLPRGNWNEPSTIIIGFKDFILKDTYFLKRKNKKKKKINDFRYEILNKKSKYLDNKFKKDIYIK